MSKELELLKQGILNEEEGYSFYHLAAQQADNKESAAALEEIANEELKHKQWLIEMYEKLSNNSAEEFDIQKVVSPSPEVFRWENVPIDDISKALSVFSIGVKLEQETIDFYQNAKQQTDNSQLQKLLDELIKWERHHLEDFQKEYETLQQEWWDQQRFSPH